MVLTNANKEIHTVKIIDFGFSIFVEDIDETTPRCGTMNFIAPEVHDRKKTFGKKIDVFSIGVIMYFLLSGELPFDGSEGVLVRKNIIGGKWNFNAEIFEQVTVEAK